MQKSNFKKLVQTLKKLPEMAADVITNGYVMLSMMVVGCAVYVPGSSVPLPGTRRPGGDAEAAALTRQVARLGKIQSSLRKLDLRLDEAKDPDLAAPEGEAARIRAQEKKLRVEFTASAKSLPAALLLSRGISSRDAAAIAASAADVTDFNKEARFSLGSVRALHTCQDLTPGPDAAAIAACLANPPREPRKPLRFNEVAPPLAYGAYWIALLGITVARGLRENRKGAARAPK
jgi:hypothetical protein